MNSSDEAHGDVDRQLAATLDSLEGAPNYMGWIVGLMAPYLDGPILELGAGHGTFTEAFTAFGEVHAVEPGETASSLLRERFANRPNITVSKALVAELAAEPAYGSAVMVNVLEHIEDDADALAQIHARLVPGGHLGIWVPAFQLLFSDFDRRLGHHRRYRREPLADLVQQAGYQVVDARYVNMPGWLSWLIITRFLGLTPSAGPLVTAFDRFIVPLTRALERVVRVPFGQSVLVIARKPLKPEASR